uniref:Uncharacterized protein n=1 Tax=Glossina brevipalpis TaxID=37001 RepID=A0A1A9WR25_9MUSC
MGHVGPRISMGQRLSDATARQGATFTMFCPVQAYPMPNFRIRVLFSFTSVLYFAEPMGSVAPKISVENRLKNAEALQKNTATLFCPGQAYPVPRFG